MGSFAHPMHYFAAAGENDEFVIAQQIFLKTFMQLIWVYRRPDFECEDKQKFLKIFEKSRNFSVVT